MQVIVDEITANAKMRAYRRALEVVAFAGTSQPAALSMPEADWYRLRLMEVICVAARALARIDMGVTDEDD